MSFPSDPYSIPGMMPVVRFGFSMGMKNYSVVFCIMILYFSLVGVHKVLQEHTATITRVEIRKQYIAPKTLIPT
jgi:hypothetical protein